MNSDPKWYMPRRNSFSFVSIDLFDLTLIVKVFSKDSLDCTSLCIKWEKKTSTYVEANLAKKGREKEADSLQSI